MWRAGRCRTIWKTDQGVFRSGSRAIGGESRLSTWDLMGMDTKCAIAFTQAI
jgi:hypothetical protein